MEKLNDVLERARLMHKHLRPIMVDIGEIEAIAEAFRALEQRAEAAEAKLTDYEKQEPVAYWHHSGQVVTRDECCDDKTFAICCKVERPLFARPAPAVSLAELVPDEGFLEETSDESMLTWQRGWNACRATILRNIEEAK